MMVKALILSDIHSNYMALQAIIDREAPIDCIICAGDLVVGGPQPNEVISMLKEFDGYFVLGNHDMELIQFHKGNQFWSQGYQALLKEIGLREIFVKWLQWEYQQIIPENLLFLESMHETVSIHAQNLSIRLCHGHDWSVRLLPDSTDDDFQNVSSLYDESVIISGHTHTQFERSVGGKLFVNPGTVGGDYRLGHSNACYAVIQEGMISLKHTGYDVDEFCHRMNEVPLPNEYNRKLQEAYRKGQPVPGFEFLDYTHLLGLSVY
ncbi:metallophosphoesterase family protein [Candidatus Poribacteria bacterium]|nr:metallophosphoesterase family protein [Candidatus Poribacteria bacterium]